MMEPNKGRSFGTLENTKDCKIKCENDSECVAYMVGRNEFYC